MKDIEKQDNKKGEEIIENPFYEAMVEDYQLYVQSIGIMEDYEKLDFYIYVIKKMSRPVNLEDKYWIMSLSLEDYEIVQRYLNGELSSNNLNQVPVNTDKLSSDSTKKNGTCVVKRLLKRFTTRKII